MSIVIFLVIVVWAIVRMLMGGQPAEKNTTVFKPELRKKPDRITGNTPRLPARSSVGPAATRTRKKAPARSKGELIQEWDPSQLQESLGTDWWLPVEPSASVINLDLERMCALAVRIGTAQDDPWTVRVNAFKFEHSGAVEKAASTIEIAAPSLLQWFGTDTSRTVIVPALRSSDDSC